MPSIKDLIQTAALPFFVKQASTDTTVDLDDDATMLKLSGWMPQVCTLQILQSLVHIEVK